MYPSSPKKSKVSRDLTPAKVQAGYAVDTDLLRSLRPIHKTHSGPAAVREWDGSVTPLSFGRPKE